MGRWDDLRNIYVTDLRNIYVTNSRLRKEATKHKQQNESNQQPPQVRIKCVFVFELWFATMYNAAKTKAYLLISITQRPVRGVLVRRQNPLACVCVCVCVCVSKSLKTTALECVCEQILVILSLLAVFLRCRLNAEFPRHAEGFC